MNRSFQDEVEEVVRRSEILAVARALESGDRPRVGQTIDYVIEGVGVGSASRGVPKQKPYRTVIEQWHLDEAHAMVSRGTAR